MQGRYAISGAPPLWLVLPRLSAGQGEAHVAVQRFVLDRRRVGEAAERMMQFTVLIEWTPLLTASQCAKVVLCFNPLKIPL